MIKDALLSTVTEEHATLEAFASLLVYEEKALAILRGGMRQNANVYGPDGRMSGI